jgi:hypothetical protein
LDKIERFETGPPDKSYFFEESSWTIGFLSTAAAVKREMVKYPEAGLSPMKES